MDSPPRRKKLGTWEGVAIGLGGALVFAVMCASVLPHARTHDFLGFYTGGLLIRTDPAHLYDSSLQSRIQYRLAPEIPVFTPIPRPAFSLAFYVPLTLMPLKTAFAIWIALGIAVAFGIWYWAFRRFGPEALVYCSLFIPLGFGIAHGQDIAFISALLIFAYTALERGRKALGGVLLALLLCKFHLFLLIPIVLLTRREWRILAGYVPTALVAVVVSSLIASPQSYLDFLRNPKLDALNPSPEMMVNVHSLAINLGLDYAAVRVLLILLVVVALAAIPKSAPLDRWFWAAIAGGLLVSPHTFAYDVALLLPAILKTLFDPKALAPARWIAIAAIIPFTYFLGSLPAPLPAGPALLVTLLFVALAWPECLGSRAVSSSQAAASPSPA